jgi:hypothetical protein
MEWLLHVLCGCQSAYVEIISAGFRNLKNDTNRLAHAKPIVRLNTMIKVYNFRPHR